MVAMARHHPPPKNTALTKKYTATKLAAIHIQPITPSITNSTQDCCDVGMSPSLLRLNVTIPRHAGGDNSSFLPLSLNHPIGSARIDLHSGGCPLTLTLCKRCLLVQWINRHTISARVTTAV